MRTAIGSALCVVAFSICFSNPATAQTNAPGPQVPEALLRRLALRGEFPELQKKAESPSRDLSGNASLEPNRLNDKKSLQDWLRQHIDPALFESSSECGHILIYVPPVTDTKMIIKVPEDTANGQKTPSVKACGEDLRRVDTPRPAPPTTPSGNGALVPLRAIANPH